MSDWVTIHHPDIEGTAEVTPAAAAAYAEKGWQVVEEPAPAPVEASAAVEQPVEQPAVEQPVEQPAEAPVEQAPEPAPEPSVEPPPSDTPIGDGIAATPPIQPEV